jgi:hypothetical protein
VTRRWPLWLLRVVLAAAAVQLADQAVLAGQFLGGTYGSLQSHRDNATGAGLTILAAVVPAVLVRWPGRGPWWPIAACLALFALTAAQIAVGFARILPLHVPLGVAIVGLTAWLTIWSWRYRPATVLAPVPEEAAA